MTGRTCKHCQKPIRYRTGRGLCPECYGNAAIKAQYPPLGKEISPPHRWASADGDRGQLRTHKEQP